MSKTNWKPLANLRPGTFNELVARLEHGEALVDTRHGGDYDELRDWLDRRRRTVNPQATRAAKATGLRVRTSQFLTEASPGMLVAGVLVYVETEDDGL